MGQSFYFASHRASGVIEQRKPIDAPWSTAELADLLDVPSTSDRRSGSSYARARDTSARDTRAPAHRNLLEEETYLPIPTKDIQSAGRTRAEPALRVFVPTDRRVTPQERKAILAASPQYELEPPDLRKRQELEDAYRVVTGSRVTSQPMSNLLAASWRVHGDDTPDLLLDLFEENPTTTNLLLRLRAALPRKGTQR